MTYKPTAKSYFSGCGGMDLGIINAGINIVQSLELDTTCCQTLSLNFSHSIIQTDITTQTVLDQPKTDIIIGTYPCTKYSTIADIHGTRTGDDLYLHFFRHIALEQPEMYIIENVPGMKKFKVVMEAMTKLPNYYINIFCPLDASNWLPQKRKRLILFGTKKPIFIHAPEEGRKKTLKDILEKDPEIVIPQYFYNRFLSIGGYRDKPIISDPDKGDLAPTAVAHYSKDISTRVLKDKRFKYSIRPYTNIEYSRLQGFPDSFVFAGSTSEIFKQTGNAVPVDMAEWIGREAMKYFN
jgi:DNA (cytosine-5)-methyltransferase 1